MTLVDTPATPTTATGGPTLAQERRLVTAIPGPRSQELMARKAEAVAAGVGHTLPISVVAAGGGVLVDADGNSLIDLGSGIAVTGVGNSNPRVVEAVTAQLNAFTHTCFTVSPYEGYVAVAEKLNELTPGDHVKRSALFNSGAEAVENAVKIARHYTKKQAVVAFDHAYHGRTNLTMGLTAKNIPYKSGFGPFASEVYRAPLSYPFRDGGLSGAEAAARAISVIEKQVGAENLAAIIIEPIQGEGGFIVPAPGFLPALVEWARANDVVFIADEVQTGFARTGAWFASEHEGIVPDLVVAAKGIAGGLPLSAVTGRAEIMDSAMAGGLGGTYAGSPIACAAALATIETYEQDGLIERARRSAPCSSAASTRCAPPTPASATCAAAARWSRSNSSTPRPAPPTRPSPTPWRSTPTRTASSLLTCGTYGNVIRFLPPLTISDELLIEGLGVIAEGLKNA